VEITTTFHVKFSHHKCLCVTTFTVAQTQDLLIIDALHPQLSPLFLYITVIETRWSLYLKIETYEFMMFMITAVRSTSSSKTSLSSPQSASTQNKRYVKGSTVFIFILSEIAIGIYMYMMISK